MKESLKLINIGNLYGPDRGTGYAGNVWGMQGLCPALTTMGGQSGAFNN